MNRTPKLRFEMFEDEWNQDEIKNLVTFFKGGNLSKSDITEDGDPCILYGELYTKYKEVINIVQSRTDVNKKMTMSKKNDVLLPSSGETALDISSASAVMIDGVALGGDLNVLRPGLKLDGRFFSYSLNSANRIAIARVAQGNSVVHLYPAEIGKIKLMYPSLLEQQKIADFFSTLDSRIEIQEEKIKNLEDQKKGYMQRIFSQEIRFKDENGEDYPEWEEKRLGEIGEIITGSTPKTNDRSNYGGEYLFVSPADMGNNKYIVKTEKKLSTKGFNKTRKIPVDSILVTCIGSTIGKIGISTTELATNQQINTIVPNNDTHYSFIYYSLEHNFPRYLKNISIQAVPIINKTQFMDLTIFKPTYIEQEKIANFLSLFDEKIEIEKEILETLQEMKKGFLQKMFV